MNSDFEEKLQRMNPKQLSQSEKAYLWSGIREGMAARATNSLRTGPQSPKSFWKKFSFSNLRKYAFVPALITAFLAGSLGTAVAFADNSTPGDFLFPVDIAAEKILLTLTFGESNDKLQLRFAEERLEEVKSLLALAAVAEVATSTDDTTATSTDNGTSNTDDDSNATTTDDGVDDDTGTTTDNGSNSDDSSGSDSDDEVDPVHIDKAQAAFLIALAHLEDARAKLTAKGNDIGAAVIDDMIAELTALAEEHVANLQDFKIKVKENDDKIKIDVEVKTDELKTKFKFEQDLDGDDDESEIEVSANSSGSKVKIDDGEFKISQSVKEKSNSISGNDRVEICHTSFDKRGKKETRKVSERSLQYYLDRGDTLGKCEDDDDDDDRDEHRDDDDDDDHDDRDDEDDDGDDDDDDDKKITICHKDKNTIKVSIYAQWAHFAHGDHKGKCKDEDDDDDDDGDQDDTTAPTISNLAASVNTTSATISWTTNEKATSTIWYATSSPVVLSPPSLSVSDDTFRTSHSVDIESLLASTTYYLIVVVSDEAGNITESLERTITTDPEPDPGDITPPVISGIAADTRITAADITWTTDEDADSKVWYSDTSPVNLDSPTDFVSSGSLTQDHFLTINSLTASTTYYYVIESKDASGNVATSSELSFMTESEPVDETPPVISNINAAPTTTEAIITWNTDEAATSKIFYSDTSPVDPATDDSVEDGSLVTNHSLDLTSLIPDTMYYYLVVSADALGNTSTSSEQSFTTDPEPELADALDVAAFERRRGVRQNAPVFDLVRNRSAIEQTLFAERQDAQTIARERITVIPAEKGFIGAGSQFRPRNGEVPGMGCEKGVPQRIEVPLEPARIRLVIVDRPDRSFVQHVQRHIANAGFRQRGCHAFSPDGACVEPLSAFLPASADLRFARPMATTWSASSLRFTAPASSVLTRWVSPPAPSASLARWSRRTISAPLRSRLAFVITIS